MQILHDLLADLPEGRVLDVRVGLFWTAVVVDTRGQRQCGLASTLLAGAMDGEMPHLSDAGDLTRLHARELAQWLLSQRTPESSIGMATVNALLPREPMRGPDLNAETILAEAGAGKRVALVGHFPFVPRLREAVGRLDVLELRPREDDQPADAAARILPEADVLAITGTSLLNGTFAGLMRLRKPSARVMVLGPSTPLSPILFGYGVDWISGSLVEDINAVLRAVSEGAGFRRIHQKGVRFVIMDKNKRNG